MPIFVWFLGKVVVMAKKRVLFISQEIVPYLPESEMANIGRFLPQGIQDKGKEIRTFMPRYGCINERRNQLHEVIRLSGMNLIINDTDHPLIIKVASIQAARMRFISSTTRIIFNVSTRSPTKKETFSRTTTKDLFSSPGEYSKPCAN